MANWPTLVEARPPGSEVPIRETLTVGNRFPDRAVLSELPLHTKPSTIAVDGFVEVGGAPNDGEYQVAYDGPLGGTLLFSAATNGQVVTVSYLGTGSVVYAYHINDLAEKKRDADVPVPVNDLGAIGTADSTTFLRGDGVWVANTHEGRTDNPHAVTAAQVGAAPVVHAHTIADTTGLQGALDAKQDAATAATDAELSAHTSRVDNPHQVTSAQVGAAPATHSHVIADTTGLQGALDAKQDAATAATDAELAAHTSATTNVHGIADTSQLVLTNDARLSDARTPTAHAASHAKGAADALGLGTFSLADLGTRSYADLQNIPTSFPPSAHTHAWADVSKTGSSLADLGTRSAADLTSGTLSSARLAGAYTGITGVGTLAGLTLAPHTTQSGGIAFGTDTYLHRSAAGTLYTPGGLIVAGTIESFGLATFRVGANLRGAPIQNAILTPNPWIGASTALPGYNLLQGANTGRYPVTTAGISGNIGFVFDGLYENGVTISADVTGIIEVDFTARFSSGVVYSDGVLVLSFFPGRVPRTIKVERLRPVSGVDTWVVDADIADNTSVARTITLTGFNFVKKLRVSLYHPTTQVNLTEAEYLLSRPESSQTNVVLPRYSDTVQELTAAYSWRDTTYAVAVEINPRAAEKLVVNSPIRWGGGAAIPSSSRVATSDGIKTVVAPTVDGYITVTVGGQTLKLVTAT